MGPRVPAVAASTFDPDAADALLREHGCVVIEGVVPRAACAAASTLVDSLLAEALSRCGQTSTSDDVSGSSDDALAAAHRLFGNVLAPTRRRDLRVPLAEAIRACVYPALEQLRPVLAATLTEDALVAELSALVCDPGAAAQPLHPDTQILGARSAAPLLTAFIALDDVLAPERGPTEIVLRSHDAAAHDALRAAAPSAAAAAAAAAAPEDGGAATSAALLVAGFGAPVPALLSAGDVLLMDSRAVHRGSANGERGERRTLLYVTLQVPENAPPGSTYSLLPEYRGRLRLRTLDRWGAPSDATVT